MQAALCALIKPDPLACDVCAPTEASTPFPETLALDMAQDMAAPRGQFRAASFLGDSNDRHSPVSLGGTRLTCPAH